MKIRETETGYIVEDNEGKIILETSSLSEAILKAGIKDLEIIELKEEE